MDYGHFYNNMIEYKMVKYRIKLRWVFMSINELFKSFKKKMFLEAFFSSFVISLTSASIAVFVLSAVYHLLVKELPVLLWCGAASGIFILTFAVVFFVKYYPTDKRVAKRLDRTGLKERAATMLEFMESDEKMAQYQRNDAVLHIKRVNLKDIKFRPFKKKVLTALVCVCLAATLMVVPYDILAGEKTGADEVQKEIIKDMLDKLREEIKNSVLDENLKDEVKDVVDRLEEDLEKTDNELDAAGKIEDAKDKIDKIYEKALSSTKIGMALCEYELTFDLGKAVIARDTGKVSVALDNLEKKLLEERELTAELARIIKEALEKSGVDKNDSLYGAFLKFAEALEGLDVSSENFAEELKMVFDAAEAEINEILKKQQKVAEEKENIDKIMDDAKNELLDKKNEEEKKPGEGEEGGGGDEGDGKPGEEGKPGEDGKPGEGEKPGQDGDGKKPGDGGGDSDQKPQGGSMGGNGTENDRTEGVYDPFAGKVEYGEVFAKYYAEYLKALENGKVPEELQDIMNKYFASLN